MHIDFRMVSTHASVYTRLYRSTLTIRLKGKRRKTAKDLLIFVPSDMRSIVEVYLQSQMPQDEPRARELCEQYGLKYSAIRRAWGVTPIGETIEVVGIDDVARKVSI